MRCSLNSLWNLCLFCTARKTSPHCQGNLISWIRFAMVCLPRVFVLATVMPRPFSGWALHWGWCHESPLWLPWAAALDIPTPKVAVPQLGPRPRIARPCQSFPTETGRGVKNKCILLFICFGLRYYKQKIYSKIKCIWAVDSMMVTRTYSGAIFLDFFFFFASAQMIHPITHCGSVNCHIVREVLAP